MTALFTSDNNLEMGTIDVNLFYYYTLSVYK